MSCESCTCGICDDAGHCSDHCTPDGSYKAKVIDAKIGKSDFNRGETTICYVLLRFCVTEKGILKNRVYEWKGPITRGGIYRTVSVLNLCGARMEDGDLSDLQGVGSNTVLIELKTVECFEAEGSFRTFVRGIKPCSS